jgi:hypothetical protein
VPVATPLRNQQESPTVRLLPDCPDDRVLTVPRGTKLPRLAQSGRDWDG